MESIGINVSHLVVGQRETLQQRQASENSRANSREAIEVQMDKVQVPQTDEGSGLDAGDVVEGENELLQGAQRVKHAYRDRCE